MIVSKTTGKMLRGVFGALAIALGALALVVFAIPAMAATAMRDADWQTYRSEGFQLRFDYPAGLFPNVSDDVADGGATGSRRTGRIFSTADGRAQLQVGAFDNVDRLTASELRARALKTSYDGAAIDYDRLAPTWFVLSGRRGEEMFYERITLSCGGKRIDVWTMNYPTAERAMFDRVVEDMARRYRGALRQVQCQ